MATLTLSEQHIRPLQLEEWTPVEPQGMEDKKLREAAEAALCQWQERSEYLLAVIVSDEEYNSVPLQPAFTARVTYRHVGPLKPLPYPLDE